MHHVIQYVLQILQLEAGLLRSEQERDKVVESAFHVRTQSQTKITQLRTNIQVLDCVHARVYMYIVYMTCIFV